MQAERIGSHLLHGPINLISQPDCYIFKDVSLDINIDMTYVRHLSSHQIKYLEFCTTKKLVKL